MNNVSEYFAADHDRLDALFADFQRLKRADFAAAKEKFKAFLKGLTRHIVWEEDVLFPAFEEKTGMRGMGPTEVMRREHRMIKGRLDAIHDKVRAADPNSDEDERALLELLSAHNMKEESILYPAIDRGLEAGGLADIQRALEAIPEQRYACCCHAADAA
ncbi:MAG: hemerythrin domain-containing protein [Elusimicrobia bacterium]|nr:hemerythrin domain-containing protein [Elusimicrobiota bacterium]MDE2425223.1 hemerythrin domain-containing protein [Elusimicrobiota bacterium]